MKPERFPQLPDMGRYGTKDGKPPGPSLRERLATIASAGGTPRATLAYVLLTAGWAALVAAAYLWWGPPAAVAAAGVGCLLVGVAQLYVATMPVVEGGQGG